MNQGQRLQQVASVLREKASQFEANKERSKKQILVDIKELRDLISTVESSLLGRIDQIFGDNLFAAALSEVVSHSNNTSVDCNKLERVSMEPVQPVIGPSPENDFLDVQKVILELINFERKAKVVQLKIVGKAASFDSIELSWGSVPGAVAYQVEGRRPNDSVAYKIYEGNSLNYTVAGLEPGTKYLFRLRSVFSDGTVSEWSKKIEVVTQEVPVPCNVTASAILWDTVSVLWSPAPAERVSYRVCVMETTANGPRSCVVDCGQKMWYRPSGLQPSTKYSFSVQAGRGNTWGKWSSTVVVETPQNFTRQKPPQSTVVPTGPQSIANPLSTKSEKTDVCAKKWDYVWKECPGHVGGNRKYSVDEKNPRIVTNIKHSCGDCTIIGDTPVPLNRVISWNIKILKTLNNGSGIYIGVAPSDIDQNEDEDYNTMYGWYFNCYGLTLCTGFPHNGKDYDKKGGRTFTQETVWEL